MNDRRLAMDSPSDAHLETLLVALGAEIQWPATPDLSVPQPAFDRRFLQGRRRVLVAAAIVLLALGAALALSGEFRESVAGLFGVDGLSIEFRRHPNSSGSVDTPASSLSIGSEISLNNAKNKLPFVPRIPDELGPPDAAFLLTLPGNDQMLSLVYLPSDQIPETAETGVGLLLMQFMSTFESGQLVKTLITDFSQVQVVTIGGREAYWIEGLSELTILADPASGAPDLTTRPTANVLIWQADGITFRLESSLPRDHAMAIANSLGPTDG